MSSIAQNAPDTGLISKFIYSGFIPFCLLPLLLFYFFVLPSSWLHF